ncbi:hypothetical protein B0O80DRAFT_530783 [Mortierella sp. GBAus27b]|nr:hypothetical protein BGX31_001125 [Mortierella sp. GBA43]KAI8351337.1 hypothetical protein B0O80DRAFT_530783 [Mortierella sp. GBAus27b]
MDLMKENQPAPVDAARTKQDAGGLDLLLKAAQRAEKPATLKKEASAGTKKSKESKDSKGPTMVLTGSYDSPVIVGRGSQATLNLGRTNKQVSRRHAIVEWYEDLSSFHITVLGQNGVRINGVGYPSGQKAVLQDGNVLDLVGVKMLFRVPSGQQHSAPRFLDEGENNVEPPSGLETPKRAPKAIISAHHKLATPSFSSPISDSADNSPLPMTPAARIRYKMQKYDLASPPTSEAGTEFGSSPVKSRPIFVLPDDDSPVRKPLGLELPSTDDNVFLDDQPLRTPTKSSGQRAPLAPLSLKENGQSNVPRTQSAAILRATTPSGAESQPVSTAKAQSKANKKSTPGVKENDQKGSVAKEEKSKISKDSQQPAKESKTKESQQMTKAAKTPSQTAAAPSNTPKDRARATKGGDDAIAKSRPSSQVASDSASQTKSQEDSDDEEEGEDDEASAKKPAMDLTEMIIDTLVFARKKKSMTLSELFDEMIASQPSLVATQTQEEVKEQMLECLGAARCVGKIARKGKDAYNKPLESQWYYIPECDHNAMRKQTRQEVMPSARKCTLKDKQYFFKMPPKLPYHRKSASPYAVKAAARRTKEQSQLSAGIDEFNNNEAEGSSSSEVEEDGDETVQSKRKRKTTVSGHTDKKRKSKSFPKDETAQAEDGHDETAQVEDGHDGDDDGADTRNDSLDDLSDISGLSD